MACILRLISARRRCVMPPRAGPAAETYRSTDIGSARISHDDRRPLVDYRIPDGARLVVSGIAGHQDLPLEVPD
jgi:hypothetical protein